MSLPFDGFIVHIFNDDTPAGARLNLAGRLSDGRSFAAARDRITPGFFVRASDREAAGARTAPVEARDTPMRTMDGEPCVRLTWETVRDCQSAYRALGSAGIRTYEGDLRLQDQFLLAQGIHGSVSIEGPFRPGKNVERVFANPRLAPSGWEPRLSVLSIDIETDVEAGTILAVGLILACPWEERYREQVLLLHGDGDELEAAEVDIRTFGRERDLLAELRRRVLEWDPDIVTGWNVVDFDLRVIAARFAVHDLPLILGRARVPDVFLDQTRALGSRMIIHGRQVLDGVRLVRAGPVHFPDYSLDTVACELLGHGKSLSQAEQENKLASLRRLYREEPARFCAYCAQDARLVLEILEKTGLLELTLRRCRLTGVSLERAWTSIAAFEYLYIEALHERGVVAPSPGVDSLPLEATPGGAILPPQPGLYDNVFVFDFRSLYPSIIRTFNIDPLSLVRLADRSALDEGDETRMIRAPNGALFRREPAILPRLLDRFFQGREEAKARGDAVASYVYKIIMNSFYGVLGASGCRFAGSELAGAITGFGHSILSWCHSTFAEEGYRVLYGDTDSLFVLSSHPADAPPGELYRTGRELCLRINERLEEHLGSTVQVESRLVLELEKIYARFFLPRIRGGGRAGVADRSPRGRAKGYAGLPLEEGGRAVPPAELPLEIVGMEAVRRDWTGLARQLQIRLLRMIFERTPREQVQSYIRGLVEELYAGALDESLVYVKALRKPVSEYRHSLPPHVRAAAQLDRSAQRGLIHYVWTKDGPQPAYRRRSAPDYDHYLEKQLRPIASVFADALDLDIDRLLSADQQQWLF